MGIPFIDLKKQFGLLETDIRAAMDVVLAHGQYINGPEVGKLEAELAAFAGTRYAVGCASGTDALLMPLMAYGVGPGDAVFTTTFTFIATAEVIAFLGATPVFVDIDPDTYNIDPSLLKEAVARVRREGKLRPKAVIPVDLFGLPADYDAIMAIADAEGLIVLEDAAQGFGGIYKNRRACSFGHVAATSFFPAKPLGCYGDGGAIFTNDDDMLEKLLSIRAHGQGSDRYENVRIGINGRLDTLQAAVLRVKLGVFSGELDERQRVAEQYSARLAGLLKTPVVPEGFRSAWAQYSVQVDDRDACRAALQKVGVPTAVYYPKPLHLQTAFAYLGGRAGDCPVAEAVAGRIFSMPMHPYLEDAQIEEIAGSLSEFLR